MALGQLAVALLLLLLVGPTHCLKTWKQTWSRRLSPRHVLTDLDDYEPEIDRGRGGYIPGLGLESMVFTVGESRDLLVNELEPALTAFPNLRQAVLSGLWPVGKESQSRAQAVAAQLASGKVLSESDIEQRMEVFRKVILGVEKYRISNPGNIASKYVDFLSACLRTPGAWGCAAYSLEYAGLVFRDHVKDGAVPELDLSSLWQQAQLRLLDLEFNGGGNGGSASVQETATDRAARLSTADQRHFAQLPLGREGEASVRDMLCGVLRVALRAVLSREGVERCRVKLRDESWGESSALLPGFSSVRLLLGLDFALLESDSESFGLGMGNGRGSGSGGQGEGEGEGDDKDEEEEQDEGCVRFVVGLRR